MKDWIKRWLGIEPSLKKDFEDLAAASIEALGNAQREHISDLRVLIDKGHEREATLAAMVKLALEHQFYRSAVSSKPAENKLDPVLPAEQLTDVAVFDEKDDAALIKEQQQREKELNQELAGLIGEQNQEGIHKVTA